jgi:4-amino-4-deoxy-L-arabinose transferase-like glycosyltransferase
VIREAAVSDRATTGHRPETVEIDGSLVVARGPSSFVRLGLALLVGLLAIVLRLPELDRYATIDESRWVSRSADFGSHLNERDLDKTFIVGHPGVTTMWLGLVGLGPERVRAFSYLEGQTDVTRRDGYLEALVAARYPPLVANAAAQGVMVWLAWGLLGPGPAALGGLLMLLDPFLVAHSRLIHLDALLASFMGVAALASIAFWGGAERSARQNASSWSYVVVAGLATGLALLTKAPGLYLVAFVPALATFEHVRSGRWRRPSGWTRWLLGLAAWLGLAGLVCALLWPALRLRPLAVLRQTLDFATRNAAGERDNFFLGQPIEDPGPLFYPVALLFRATPLMLLGVVLLAYAIVRWRRQSSSFWPALLLCAYAGGFVVFLTLAQKKFDRYELPVFPVLDLLAGLGLWMALRGLLRRRNSLSVAVAALAAWPVLSVYPYYLAYYNPLLGGGSLAQRVLFVGWGEGLDRVAAYLNAKPIVLQAPTVATAYHRVLEAHLHGNNAMPLEQADLADYIVPYINGIQRHQKAEVLSSHLSGQDPEYVVWLNGIEYAQVYRGPHLPIDRPLGVDFGAGLRLESVVLAPGSARVRTGEDVQVRLRWRPSADVGPLAAVMQVMDPNGRPAVQDRQPLSRGFREGGLLVLDARLSLPNTLAPGDYSLQTSVEDSGSGRALNLPSGEAAVVVQQLTVVRAQER